MPATTKWGEIPCPKCKEPKAASASICPHCRTEFSDEEIGAHKKELRDNRYAGIVGTIILLLMVGGCSWSFFGNSEGSKEEKAASVTAYIGEVEKAVAQCDLAYEIRGDEFTSEDMVAVYKAADHMADQCRETFVSLGSLEVPDNLGEDLNKKFTHAHEICRDAYFSKWQYAEMAKKVANGDFSPKMQVELTKLSEAVINGTLLCASLIADAAKEVGVDARKE